MFPILSNVRLFAGSNITFNEYIFINAIKPDNSYKNSTILIANSKGYLCNVNSIAMGQFGLPKIANCEYRYNIRAIREDILVSNDFRDKKQFTHFNKYNFNSMISGFVEVKPLCLSIPPDSNSTTSQFNEKTTLAGYVTTINFNQVVADTTTTNNGNNSDINFVMPETARNANIWKFMNKKFGTNHLENEMLRGRDYEIDLQDNSMNGDDMLGDISDLHLDGNARILTKRLWKGKLVDLVEKRFDIVNNVKRIKTEEEFDPKETVFKDVLDPDKNSCNQTKIIFRKNLLEKITEKEKNNFKIKLFYMFSVFWLALAMSFNSLVLIESYKFTDRLLEQLSAGRNAADLLAQTSSVMTNIYEIELVLANKNMINSTAIEKDRFINQNFKNIDKVISTIIDKSNSLSQYLSVEAMESVFDFTYNLDSAGQFPNLMSSVDVKAASGLLSEFETMNYQTSSLLQDKLDHLIVSGNFEGTEADEKQSKDRRSNGIIHTAIYEDHRSSEVTKVDSHLLFTSRKLQSVNMDTHSTFGISETQADIGKFEGAPDFNFTVSVNLLG